jgi:3-deoxy-D-manno-octulosonic acid kinase
LSQLATWMREALGSGSIHRVALRTAERTHSGRGIVPIARIDGSLLAFRHYHRGGVVAALLRDRYARLGEPRPLRELLVSEGARGRGVPTPRVVAGAVYARGPFYSADLVTEYVDDAVSLAAAVLEEAGPGRYAGLAAASRLAERMARAGLHHPDLNATNILLTTDGQGARAHVLDLDRARLTSGGSTAGAPMRSRLVRSLRKLAATAGQSMTEPECRLILAEGEGRDA